jgi:methyl-accepting chemotaxis protein
LRKGEKEMKWISNTPIFRRLLVASLIVAIIPGIIIYLLGSTYIQALSLRGEAVQSSTNSVKAATAQLANLQHMNADLISLQAEAFVTTNILGGTTSHMNGIEQNLNHEILSLQSTLDRAIPAYQRSYQLQTAPNMSSVRTLLASNTTLPLLSNDQRQTLERVAGSEWSPYVQAQGKVLQALAMNRPAAETQPLLVTANNLYGPLERDWQHIVDLAERIGDTVATVTNSQTMLVQIYATIAIIGIIVVVTMIGLFVNFTLVRPLRQLAALTRKISGGETSARASVAGQDEIYMVAKSINAMLDQMVELIQITQAQRDTLQTRIETLVSEVGGAGEGDLRVQATVTDDALGMLSESFNYMIYELGNLVLRVQTASREVELSTRAVFNRLADLVQASNTQLRHIAGAAHEIQQMADFSRQVAHRIRLLDNVAGEASLTVQTRRQSVQRAARGMASINNNIQTTASKVQTLDRHSREINTIIMDISNIANQTNMLAHDAAKQVSNASENGRGFAAVAGDIQRLAERTKDETGSVAYILSSVRDDIQEVAASMQTTEGESANGMKLTQEAGASLEAIFDVIEQQARESEYINQMAAEQLQSFDTILRLMHSIFQTTRQIYGTTGETSQQVQYLAWQVNQLRASVSAFKLRDGQANMKQSYPDLPTLQEIQSLYFVNRGQAHPNESTFRG